jgi:hypothetical protein
MKLLKSILDRNIHKQVFFGSHGFYIVKSNQLDKMQLGYSIDPDGNNLCGVADGGWSKEWIVFATDAEIGDPFFVDIRDANLPVYTAMHGIRDWNPVFVSKSLDSFIKVMSYLQSLSKQTESLIEPNKETIVDADIIYSIQKKIVQMCGVEEFWNDFFEQYIDWIEDFDC